MWDDLIIGKGNKLGSSMRVLEIKGDHSISENSISYWISHNWMNTIEVGITIFKNTEEGKELKSIIDKKTPLKDINTWLDKLIIKKYSYTKLTDLIKKLKVEYFKKGQKSRSQEIAKLLGLTEIHIYEGSNINA